ncbi:hypothetical protein BSR28_06915 [Boudabousia liubingyangii]|uniref:hypothetical protein n=1 Tax=Boudabousia liubingyangii TaxID=1921764 RepID=UPI00093B6467|nr:hypothetical protein [Boudabousia liubingyangii]OKL46265.1 hypothetical protein BSR28_06915 [Boudabousia liubingyangii]
MNSTYWESLGFDSTQVQAEYEGLIEAIVQRAQTEVRTEKPEDWEQACYYVDPSGFMACVFIHKNGEASTNFTIHGQPGVTFYTFQVRPGLGVGQYLLPDPEDPNNVTGCTPFFLEYTDPLAYPVPVGEIDGRYGQTFQNYRLAAIAVNMEVHPSLESWAQAYLDLNRIEPADYLTALGDIESPSYELMNNIEQHLDDVHGGAILGGICEHVEERTNGITGNKWLYATVNQGAVKLNIALPYNIEPRPEPGNVIYGQAIMNGCTERWDEGLSKIQ